MIKAVIFDMGGVLLRTENSQPREQLAERLGISREVLEKAVFHSPSSRRAEVGEISEEEHWRLVFDELGIAPEERLAFRQAFWSGDRMDYDLINLLRSLRQRYRTGLLSNAWSGARAAIEARTPFLDVFDVSLFSAEVGLRKPDERFYLEILNRLDATPGEAIFVDDYQPNITAARSLGMRAIHFLTPMQAREELLAFLDDPQSRAAN
ncbi:MAG: HAD family phosphatase [Bellilinea sp.]